MTKFDPVERPAHYNMGGIECIDYIKQVVRLDGFIAEDMQKAEWYLRKMNEALAEKHR